MRLPAALLRLIAVAPMLLSSLAEADNSAAGRETGESGARIASSAQSVGQYEKLELTVLLQGDYSNPFDPRQVEVTAVFTTPSAAALRIPGFYYEPYERSRNEEGAEALTRSGPGCFKIRFASGELGRHRFEAAVRDAQGSRSLGAGEFEVTPSGRLGYVRRSKSSRSYFEFDSGKSYFAIGENMCWPGDGGTFDYDRWMGKLAANGGNYIRLWLINEWNALGLEHLPREPGDGNGLGRYDQQAAWRIDYILDLAEQLGIEALMCIESFNSLSTRPHPLWHRYPYNAEHGGPCSSPPDFFTDPEAKRLFEQRLRYIVARWGYSPSVLAWELWNEVDITDGYDSPAVAEWHREMALLLRKVDPWSHLVATSFAHTPGDRAVDGLREMDFVQSHSYGSRDVAATLSRWSLEKARDYGKPHYVGEFGTGAPWEDWASDPQAIHFHNGLWAGMLSQCAGTGMLWWWDSYVEPRDLYGHIGAVAAFAADVDWAHENYRARPAAIRFADTAAPRAYAPLILMGNRGTWGADDPTNRPHVFDVGNDGEVKNEEHLSNLLHGSVNHPRAHNPATFRADYPAAGRFEVIVQGVSGHGGAALSISLDGKPRLIASFQDDRPDDTETLHRYDGLYGIEVPPGRHTVLVENTGADWLRASYRLTNYLTYPNLRALCLANDRSALLWVQNPDHTWWHDLRGVSVEPAGDSEVEVRGFLPGDYRIEQWDTYTGSLIQRHPHTSPDGSVTVATPPGLTTDVAYKISKVD